VRSLRKGNKKWEVGNKKQEARSKKQEARSKSKEVWEEKNPSTALRVTSDS
jgi:hypothetical protein